MSTIPLTNRNATEHVAWLVSALDWLGMEKGAVSAARFIEQVTQLAKLLPDGKHAINLSDNRYLFMLSMCAVIVRRQTNLLPPNRNRFTQENLARRFDQCYVLHDGLLSDDEVGNKIPTFDIRDIRLSEPPSSDVSGFAVPQFEADHLAVISFTSGSTGEAKANLKTWRTLAESSLINASYMLPNQDKTYYGLATVPGQHMWGLETSVLMPLFAKVCMASNRPFYPKDIQQQLSKTPVPRMLVATPLHLRALTNLRQTPPQLELILCATAPLTQKLAATIETQFAGELREIYGCSEVGSLAVRDTARQTSWQGFECFIFEQLDPDTVTIAADHLPLKIKLEDAIELETNNCFALGARDNDQIEIAGKRGSLQEVNRVLMEFDAISDGVVFFPPQDKKVPRLVCLVVPNSDQQSFEPTELRLHFAKHLDAAFIPRPIRAVSKLPRETNGKLPAKSLLEFYSQLSTHVNQ